MPIPDVTIRGRLLIGKDGHGLTPCGQARQRIVSLAPAAQQVLDGQYDRTGALEYLVEADIEDDAGHWRLTRIRSIAPVQDSPGACAPSAAG